MSDFTLQVVSPVSPATAPTLKFTAGPQSLTEIVDEETENYTVALDTSLLTGSNYAYFAATKTVVWKDKAGTTLTSAPSGYSYSLNPSTNPTQVTISIDTNLATANSPYICGFQLAVNYNGTNYNSPDPTIVNIDPPA